MGIFSGVVDGVIGDAISIASTAVEELRRRAERAEAAVEEREAEVDRLQNR